jgi:hypothetical protein
MMYFGRPPFYECSSVGDKRFSAFYAKIRSRGNRTIEELYQGYKRFADGSTNLSIKDAKGRTPVNPDECQKFYSLLWEEYFYENPGLLEVVFNNTGFSDEFGQKNHVCQAGEIWRIKYKYENIKLEDFEGVF